MRLRQFATWLFAWVLLILAANALLLVLIQDSYDQVEAAQNHRQRSQSLVDELHRETEHLAHLVRAYVATGEPQYLLRYYDILAIRIGEKPAPAGYGSKFYWDDVDAGRIVHTLPETGPKVSISDFMSSLGFSPSELQAFAGILEATAAMTKVEQKAFAAIQGMYNPETDEFVTDGESRLDYASRLVYSDEYKLLKANLSRAVDGLANLIDIRTSADVASARLALERWILLSLIFMGCTIVMAVAAHRVIRIKVLVPIAKLGITASRIATGNYAIEAEPMHGVHELEALGQTVHTMAGAIHEDIERRQKSQEELQQARKQAEDATHAKSIFLANMSHEIRTPMNAILGMAYLTLGTNLDTRQRDYVSKIHDSAKALLGIINDILDFSKVEADKLVLEYRRFQLEDVARDSLSLLRQNANEKDIELLFNVSDARLLGANCILMGDPLRLGQVLTNLISNAVKFTHKGFVRLTISVDRSDADSMTLRFTVCDTGIGLSPGQIERLFLEFTQADGSTTRKYGGTGLGLAISRRIVERMRGRIWVESVQHEGSSFIFTAQFVLAAQTSALEQTLPQRVLASDSLLGIHVLVVEDNPINQQLARDLIQSWGAIVDVADDGKQGLEILRRNAPDYYAVVLMDLQMPVLDGYETTRLIRSDSRLVNLPIIAITAHAMAGERERCLVLGMSDHISKPIDPDLMHASLVRHAKLGMSMRPGTTSPRPTSPLASVVYPFEQFHGIAQLDAQAGLRYANGNGILYQRLLTEFVRDYADFGGSVSAMLDAGQWTDAMRLTHTFKGLCGALGASQLCSQVTAFEASLVQRNLETSNQDLAPVGDAMETLAKALAMHLQFESVAHADTKEPKQPPAALDPPVGPEIVLRLSDLRRLIEENDSEALTLWASMRSGLVGCFSWPTLQEMTHVLDQFEFEKGLGLVDELEERLTQVHSHSNSMAP